MLNDSNGGWKKSKDRKHINDTRIDWSITWIQSFHDGCRSRVHGVWWFALHGMRANIKLIRKHPKIRRILRCESPYFHHWIPPQIRSVIMLERRFTKFSEITQCNGHNAVQGHSRSPILVPIESFTSYLAPLPSHGWLFVKFSLARAECLTLSLSLEWSPTNTAINDISLKTRFCGLHLRCRKSWCIFNHVYLIRLICPERYWIRWN